MGWGDYARAVLAFNAAGFVLLYALLRAQGVLPLNPDGIAGMAPDLAFNTAVSFVTNTNWQAYSGEAQLSYLSQMAGLTMQNFVSAGTGMAVAVAVIRGFVGATGATLGNFWVDLSRSVLWILLPLSVVLALFWRRRVCRRRCRGRWFPRASRARNRSSPGVLRRRRSRSSNWARMGAGSLA